MDIDIVTLHNPLLKMSIVVKRTPSKKYKYCKQIAPRRNVWVDEEYDDLERIKKDLFGEIINGYEIKTNLIGISLIDEIMSQGCTSTIENNIDSDHSETS